MRTFIAIRVPATDALTAASRQLSRLMPGLNVIPSDQWHVTLQFLGETADHLIPRLTLIMAAIAASEPCQAVSLRGLGAFPNLSRPTVIWAGFAESELLPRLAARLGEQCELLGFARESRPFQPHMTLARVKSRPPLSLTDYVRDNSLLELGTVTISSLELFRSELTKAGPEYTSLASLPLAAH